jgi:4-hydroxy-2-oxoheptanedioate aldolase
MQENGLKAAWAAGRPTYGAWLAIPDPMVAESVARQGFDYCCIDMQHGFANYADVVRMLAAMSGHGPTLVVRVPWNEPGIIGRVLDAGAEGVIIPMVNSPEEAAAAVASCRYAPAGSRSFGPIRAATALGPGYYPEANANVACIPMIETRQAVEGLDAILAVPGIDAVYVGPADLALTYGVAPGPDNPDPAYQAALATVVSSCRARGIASGIHSNAQLAPTRVAQGFQMVTCSADFANVTAMAKADLAAARETAAPDGVRSLY